MLQFSWYLIKHCTLSINFDLWNNFIPCCTLQSQMRCTGPPPLPEKDIFYLWLKHLKLYFALVCVIFKRICNYQETIFSLFTSPCLCFSMFSSKHFFFPKWKIALFSDSSEVIGFFYLSRLSSEILVKQELSALDQYRGKLCVVPGEYIQNSRQAAIKQKFTYLKDMNWTFFILDIKCWSFRNDGDSWTDRRGLYSLETSGDSWR